MAQEPRLSDTALLEHIAALPHGRANFKQLVRELGVRGGDREELEQALGRLAARGDVIEVRPGHYFATRQSREFAIGRLQMHRDGYGFLIADNPIEGVTGDVFLPPETAGKAMHGDRVIVRVSRIDPDGRADGEIVRIIRRAHPTVVGEFSVRQRGNFVIPHDNRVQQWIEIPEGLELPPQQQPNVDRVGVKPVEVRELADLDGMIVNVELIDYPENGANAVGRVIELLGYPDDFGVDVEIIIRKHHLPHRFPAEVIQEAQALSSAIRADEIAGRTDFRGMDVVTIDGETARDFDDAVWVDRTPQGNWILHVHIADVSHYVHPGSPIDTEARLRGTSVYFPDRAIPMLPLELSTGLCSLNPKVDRLCVSALLEIDNRGDIVKQEFVRGVMRSVERMTYTNVHLLLEGDAGQRERYAGLVDRFELMRELAQILTRKRVRRGSIDFDLPEPLIEFNEWGEMTGVQRAPRNIAHRIIEEFMLAANEAVAAHLERLEIPSIYRIHETPDPARVMEFEDVAAHFGYSLGMGAIPVKRFSYTSRHRDGTKSRRDIVVPDPGLSVTSRNYQKLVARIEGKPEERILSYLMLRSLKQARYSERNQGHFALAADTYTHFTSPIRRYPDLALHRVLVSTILQGAPPYTISEVHAVAEESSYSERRAAEAERELVEWKKVKFMEERLGDEFQALIISTTRFGFFVELQELFVEGLVPIETLPGDRYGYQESVRKIIGERSRREFSIGDQIKVRLDRVDAVDRKLQVSLIDAERKPKAGRAHHAPRRRP
ncbi:MAG TPA: VacB/RNase II family 3'-5' exoribonuclease [Bryobacteraceae bacterium]|nr:VacB/RNase II family 3'-5' exoribonuclease [Bryobacteraceae bacterium]